MEKVLDGEILPPEARAPETLRSINPSQEEQLQQAIRTMFRTWPW